MAIDTPAGEAPVIPLVMIGIGGYLLWFAVKYWRGTGPAVWPSYPAKSVLQGKGLPGPQPAAAASVQVTAYETSLSTGQQPRGGGASSGVTGYANPFRSIANLVPQRIDQGVDLAGTGPVYALGPGKVVTAAQGATGWGPPEGAAPGGYIEYELTGGPAAGKRVYVAEGIAPAVRTGQKVDASTVIGHMSAPIETGWASGQGTTAESATQAGGGIGGAGPFPTRLGQNFDDLLAALGVPGSQDRTGKGFGDLPPGYPSSYAPAGGKVAGGNVTPRAFYQALRENRVPAGAAVYLTAIAGVESGFSTLAWNQDTATGDDSVGLTQINFLGSLYGPRVALTGMTPQQLHESGLQGQARATAEMYRQSGLAPWQPDITSGKITGNNPGRTNWLAIAMAAAGPGG